MTAIHFVSVSGGASSAATLIRVFERYPHDSIYPVFADTNWEHPDLYRFINDLEVYIDKPIVRLNSGSTPSDISEREKMIFNSRVANCTKELKVKPLQNYVASIKSDVQPTRAFMHIGFNIKDRYAKARSDKPYGRLPSPIINWKARDVIVKYPLWFYPRIDNPLAYVEAKGLALPEAYNIKYSNSKVFITNNCYGGCFKAGAKYWRGLLLTYPDVFNERMQWENSMRAQEKYSSYAILTKTENGVKRAYPLEELKHDTEILVSNDKQLRAQLMIDDIESDCVDECQVF